MLLLTNEIWFASEVSLLGARASFDKLNFVFLRDIAPVAGILSLPYVMVVHPSVPAKTIPEFIAYAKANPGKLNLVIARHRDRASCRWRAVQGDDRS